MRRLSQVIAVHFLKRTAFSFSFPKVAGLTVLGSALVIPAPVDHDRSFSHRYVPPFLMEFLQRPSEDKKSPDYVVRNREHVRRKRGFFFGGNPCIFNAGRAALRPPKTALHYTLRSPLH